VPTPQLLELKGAALHALLTPRREALERVAARYSMRWAVCVWFGREAWPCLRALPWTCKYVKAG
jgi:hypothetical protein